LSKACELTGSSHALRVATAAFVERLTRARSLEWDTPPFLTIRLAAASLRLPGGAVDLSRTAEVLVGLQRPDGSWPWGEAWAAAVWRSEEHTSELQSRGHLVCRLLLEKKKKKKINRTIKIKNQPINNDRNRDYRDSR